MAHIHHSWAETHEEHAVFLELRAELGHDDVHGRLGGRIQSTQFNLKFVDEVKITMTAGDGDDLLLLALQDKGEEEVEEVDVARDIGLEYLR